MRAEVTLSYQAKEKAHAKVGSAKASMKDAAIDDFNFGVATSLFNVADGNAGN